MQRSGYAGAREMSREMEHLYGFQKTTPEHLSAATWQTVMDVYVKDKYRLGLRNFFERENPHARQALVARLIEVDRQGLYRFNAADRGQLIAEFTRSVARDGAACSALDCGSTVLTRHVLREVNRQVKLGSAGEAGARPLGAMPRKREMRIFTVVLDKTAKAVKTAATNGWVWLIAASCYAASAWLRSYLSRREVLQGVFPRGDSR
jgi:cobaltochelatase CobN